MELFDHKPERKQAIGIGIWPVTTLCAAGTKPGRWSWRIQTKCVASSVPTTWTLYQHFCSVTAPTHNADTFLHPFSHNYFHILLLMMQFFQETLFHYKLLVTVNLDSLQPFLLPLSDQSPSLLGTFLDRNKAIRKCSVWQNQKCLHNFYCFWQASDWSMCKKDASMQTSFKQHVINVPLQLVLTCQKLVVKSCPQQAPLFPSEDLLHSCQESLMGKYFLALWWCQMRPCKEGKLVLLTATSI